MLGNYLTPCLPTNTPRRVWSFGLFKQFCREGTEKGTLEWEFETGLACNTGMLEAAWWEATKNKYGRIGCEKK